MQPLENIDSRSNKGGLWQTIVKAIRVVVVNKAVAKAVVNKEAAREIKAADKVAKRAADKATAKLSNY